MLNSSEESTLFYKKFCYVQNNFTVTKISTLQVHCSLVQSNVLSLNEDEKKFSPKGHLPPMFIGYCFVFLFCFVVLGCVVCFFVVCGFLCCLLAVCCFLTGGGLVFFHLMINNTSKLVVVMKDTHIGREERHSHREGGKTLT